MLKVLNPALYRRLKQVFGKIKIYCAGQAATFETDRNGNVQLTHWGECYAVNCPFCNDSKHHLWFSYCWGTTRHGQRWYPAYCYRRQCLESRESRRILYDLVTKEAPLPTRLVEQQEAKPAPEANTAAITEFLNACLPCNELKPHHPAFQYLQNRGYDPSYLWEKYQLRVCDDPQSHCFARIVIPIYNASLQPIGWTARAYLEHIEPKYIHNPGFKSSNAFYGINYAIQHQDYVIIVEGPFDVFRLAPAVNDRVMATFGKTISQQKIQFLENHWQYVFVLFDADAVTEGRAYASRISNGYALQPPPGAGDPGSFNQQHIEAIAVKLAQFLQKMDSAVSAPLRS